MNGWVEYTPMLFVGLQLESLFRLYVSVFWQRGIFWRWMPKHSEEFAASVLRTDLHCMMSKLNYHVPQKGKSQTKLVAYNAFFFHIIRPKPLFRRNFWLAVLNDISRKKSNSIETDFSILHTKAGLPQMASWWPQAEDRDVSSGLPQLPARESVTTTEWLRTNGSVLPQRLRQTAQLSDNKFIVHFVSPAHL